MHLAPRASHLTPFCAWAGEARLNMSDVVGGARKRTRRSTNKLRSGCVACKYMHTPQIALGTLLTMSSFLAGRDRHIRCNEAKPICSACAVAGVNCRYPDPFRPSKHSVFAHGNVLSSPNMTSVCHNPLDELSVSNFSSRGLPNDWRDRYFLDHYRSRSLHEFSTGFDYQLWNQHICQLSASNLAVRHALVALSAQHKIHVQQKRENYLDTASTAVYAIEHYGKSIQTVNSHTSKPAGQDNFVEETLVTCLLLLCFELLRGDDLAALTHLTGAMQIMDQVLDRPQPTTAIALRKECQPIALVAKTFARLDLQCSLYVGSRSPKLFLHDHFSETCSGPIPLLMSPNAKFTDITGACNALDCCIGRSYYFMRTSAEKVKYLTA